MSKIKNSCNFLEYVSKVDMEQSNDILDMPKVRKRSVVSKEKIKKIKSLEKNMDLGDNSASSVFFSEELIVAVSSRNKDLVESLTISKEININQSDLHGYTPLIWAADRVNADIVKLILCHQYIHENQQDNNG